MRHSPSSSFPIPLPATVETIPLFIWKELRCLWTCNGYGKLFTLRIRLFFASATKRREPKTARPIGQLNLASRFEYS